MCAKSEWEVTKTLFSLVLAIQCFASLDAHAQPQSFKAVNKKDISIEIKDVSLRVDRQNSHTRGALFFAINNNTNKDIVIPNAAIGFRQKSHDSMDSSFRIHGNEEHNEVEFAKLHYSWKKAGKTVKQGSYDLTEEFKVKRNSSNPLNLAPIDIPDKAGNYELTIELDNTMIEPVLYTHSVFWNDWRFLKMKASKKISITE